MPRISIVLPTYNGEKYLADSIESVIAQTIRDWELIIVDDCSVDNTYSIAMGYAEKDSRIRVIRNEKNSRTSAALNNGFAHAKGDYLTWTSDDNLYYEDALEVMSEYLDNNPECGLAYCDMGYIGEDNEIPYSYMRVDPEEMCIKCVVGGCFLYRRQVLNTVGGYSEEYYLVEDYDYFLRISKKYELHRIPEVKYLFRIHPGAQSCTKAREYERVLYKLRLRELDYLLDGISFENRIKLSYFMYLVEKDISILDRIWGEDIPDFLKIIVDKDGRIDEGKKYIIFGAGILARNTLNIMGKDQVECFVDNDPNKWGKYYEGKEVRNADFLLSHRDDYNLVIAVGVSYIGQIIEQLAEHGINRFTLYLEIVNGSRISG